MREKDKNKNKVGVVCVEGKKEVNLFEREKAIAELSVCLSLYSLNL